MWWTVESRREVSGSIPSRSKRECCSGTKIAWALWESIHFRPQTIENHGRCQKLTILESIWQWIWLTCFHRELQNIWRTLESMQFRHLTLESLNKGCFSRIGLRSWLIRNWLRLVAGVLTAHWEDSGERSYTWATANGPHNIGHFSLFYPWSKG